MAQGTPQEAIRAVAEARLWTQGAQIVIIANRIFDNIHAEGRSGWRS